MSKKRKYSATTSDDRFDFSRSDDDFEELAKGFQPKNTKVSNCWALKIYSEWARSAQIFSGKNKNNMKDHLG